MIRTEDEFRSATARLDQEMMIARTRSLTDDEQRSLDALTQDIQAYRSRRSTTSPISRISAPAASLPVSPPATTTAETPDPFGLRAWGNLSQQEQAERAQRVAERTHASMSGTLGAYKRQQIEADAKAGRLNPSAASMYRILKAQGAAV